MKFVMFYFNMAMMALFVSLTIDAAMLHEKPRAIFDAVFSILFLAFALHHLVNLAIRPAAPGSQPAKEKP